VSALRSALADYLSVRRSLGFTLRRDAKLLTQFLSFLDSRAAETVTVEHAVAWASLPGGGPGWLAYRMSVVRGFARYLHTIDPANEVPPPGLLARRAHRPIPYLYSEADIGALVDAAGRLRYPLGVATYRTLIGLLATTGLRVGEALGLDDDDFNPDSGVLTVRGKFGNYAEGAVMPSPVTVGAACGDSAQDSSA
jgi:integrase/recombinase XerD